MSTPVLHVGTKNASSWSMRAWLALRCAEYVFEERPVDIRRPQRFADLDAIRPLSPAAAVPVLMVDGSAIFDSLAIMELANDLARGELLPTDTITRARCRAIAAWQHAKLSGICGRISFESSFYPLRRHLSEQEVAECAPLLDCLDRELRLSGGPYLFGSLSLSDLALAPTVMRLSAHEINLANRPTLETWFNRVLRHPAVDEWLAEAVQLPPIWYDEYLLPNQSPIEQLVLTRAPFGARHN